MEKREQFKIVEIAGRKWRIEKFDAMTGSYIAYKLMGHMLPGGFDGQITGGNAPKDRTVMSKKEFADLQLDCLHVCYEVLPAGKAPVIGENGAWGVMNIEDDTITVLALTVHALAFNISGFFDGNALKELIASFSGMTLFNAPTSMSSHSPR
ncbi:hypothetical protein SOV_04790 [Sporomusa ovata DSM 2662]|uniref:Phage protein n=1 Tax=Sporomusa ovata TaxID=2378 RepID=A0A0U1KXN3_9FIRM|nr:hypothetical protein [Sporomusa ovata]EQB28149.1 hypothetical protein SOV_2c10720 [Sporomusa ovata DSM 2662]CQR71683.1 hypothetical protein SpAn4DRAFT_3549 [Sporomusa ovata]